MASSPPSSCSSSTALNTPLDFEMPQGEYTTPTVTLETDEITQEMAARLTIAVLGQILYMKGQVPFPVTSLGRMLSRLPAASTSRAAARAVKKRREFIESYDVLTSHLRTTFVALSTALAQNEADSILHSTPEPASALHNPSNTNTSTKVRRRPAKVHVLLVLGPSPSAAKARILLELDGFCVERFGEWDYSCRNHDPIGGGQSPVEHESGDESSIGSSRACSPARSLCAPTTPPRTRPSEYIDERDSPCTSSSWDCGDSSSPSATSDTSFSSDEEPSRSQVERLEVNPLALAQRVEEASLRAGERLLCRALCASGEGLGFGDEISPTQTHILIRAPRRFAHPTWNPRQGLGRMLDRQVQSFLESERCSSNEKGQGGRSQGGFGAGLRTVGVRVKCQGADLVDAPAEMNDLRGMDHGSRSAFNDDDEDEEVDDDEQDEQIWWSWDGKLIGFSE